MGRARRKVLELRGPPPSHSQLREMIHEIGLMKGMVSEVEYPIQRRKAASLHLQVWGCSHFKLALELASIAGEERLFGGLLNAPVIERSRISVVSVCHAVFAMPIPEGRAVRSQR